MSSDLSHETMIGTMRESNTICVCARGTEQAGDGSDERKNATLSALTEG